jgi:hypothetical protein
MESKTNLLNIDDLFHSPQDSIARLAEMQVHLYREDASLQDYFYALDVDVFGRARDSASRPSISRLKTWSLHAVDKAARIVKSRRIKADILFSPTLYFGRKTEVGFLKRTLLGLAETGAEILCLLPVFAPFRTALDSELEAAGRSKQVTYLDPLMPLNRADGWTRSFASKLRGRRAFAKTIEILAPHGLSPTPWSLRDFEKTAEYVEAWERLAPLIEFDAVVARCNWYDLSSPICRAGIQRGKPVITFQQGVVDHTLDVPITASKFVAFGASSASVLAEANQRFFRAAGSAGPPVDFVKAGSLFDVVQPLPDQFSVRSLLLVDSHAAPRDPWGTGKEVEALLQVAKEILEAKLPLKRLVIRPHPHWSNHDLGACEQLVREHRDICEFSHPVWQLEDDLRRASVVVGIASGVLTVASACGLPTVFLRTEGGFRIRDLECFSPEQTLFPDEAFRQIERLLTDREAYAEARNIAIRNSSQYYANGSNAPMDGEFFTGLLSSQSTTKAVTDGAR